MSETKTKQTVYEIVTARIIEQLEKGKVPWKQPWVHAGQPQNLITRKPYRGLNVMLLAMLGYAQNFYITEKQLEEIGAKPREGEIPHIVVYWLWPEKDAESVKPAKHKSPTLRYYRVFNVSQCTGILPSLIPNTERVNDPIENADRIVEEMPMPPEILHKEAVAYYAPDADYVNMPRMNTFKNSESYYSVLFHELIHSTGNEIRVGRPGITSKVIYGSETYSKEELIAEIGACYLQSFSGIEPEPTSNNIGYIQSWLKKLKDDNKFIVYAATAAQKAVDFILDRTWVKDDVEVTNGDIEAELTPTPVEKRKSTTKKKEKVA